MKHMHFNCRKRSWLSYLYLVFVGMVLLFPNYVLASEIERYDFENYSNNITKHWEPEVALFVAKKFALENGENERNVSVSKLQAGATNNFIYLVHIDNEVKYVIKGLSTKNEAEALLKLQNSPIVKEAQSNPGAAKISLSKLVKYYVTTQDKQVYYFTVLEAAQGKELFKIMSNELLKTKDINTLSYIFYESGKQISELHKTIVGSENFISPRDLVTIIHDDFHPENSFFNTEMHTLTLIDNESMGETISKPLPIYREIYGLYEVPIIRWPAEKITTDLLKDADPHDIAAIYIELIKGMASVYQNPQDAKLIFTNKMIELNRKSIAFLKDSTSEPWMIHPRDKSEQHIVWGKLSHAVYDRKLNSKYQHQLLEINKDLNDFLQSITTDKREAA